MVDTLVNLSRLDFFIQKEDLPEQLIFNTLHTLVLGLSIEQKPIDLESPDIIRREFFIEKAILFSHGMNYTRQVSTGKEIILYSFSAVTTAIAKSFKCDNES